jgi:NADH:ubiquinone oxidoreductase subunit K
MVDEMATVNGTSSRLPSPTMEIGDSLRNIAADLVDMTDLQLQLVRSEARAVKSIAMRAAILFALSVGMLLAALTVVFVGGSLLVHELAGWRLSLSYLTVGGAAMLIAGVTLWITVHRLGRVADAFQGSFTELRLNLAWIRRLLGPFT